MNMIWKTFLKGLATTLPVTLTFYLIYWLGMTAEKALRPIMIAILPYDFYWPGLGLLAAIGIIFLSGIAVNAWLVKRLFDMSETLLDKIPLVKSIYGALRDFMDFFSREKKEDKLNNAVVVRIGEMHLIGFQVRDDVSGLMTSAENEDLVAIYLPLSYQIGGYTICVPRNTVQRLEMSNEDTMRWVLTAGLSTSKDRNQKSRILVD